MTRFPKHKSCDAESPVTSVQISMINVWLINCKLHFAQDWYSGDVKFIFQLWHWDLSRDFLSLPISFHGPKMQQGSQDFGGGGGGGYRTGRNSWQRVKHAWL